MRELFFTLGVLALFRHLDFSGWWAIPIIILVLFIDYFIKKAEIKSQAELEILKMTAGQIK